MSAKSKKKSEGESESASELSTLDRLTALRRDIKGQSGLTELIDILIDANDGDAAALVEEIEGERAIETEAAATAASPQGVVEEAAAPVEV